MDSDQSSAKLSFELFCSFRASKAFDFKQIWNKVAEKALFGDFEAFFSEFRQNRQISPYRWWWNFHDIDFNGLYWHDAWNESFAQGLSYLLSPLVSPEHAYPTLPSSIWTHHTKKLKVWYCACCVSNHVGFRAKIFLRKPPLTSKVHFEYFDRFITHILRVNGKRWVGLN